MNEMEPKKSNPSSRISVDVDRLDKVYSISSKPTNDVILGLSSQDKLYINALMENDSSSSSDSESGHLRNNSAWPPMIHNPVVNKRAKKLKPTSAVTLSLEDISYIRPSWVMSKGLKRVKKTLESNEDDGKKLKFGQNFRYVCFLLAIFSIVLFIVLSTYYLKLQKKLREQNLNAIKISQKERTISLLNKDRPQGIVGMIFFGQKIPFNLKHMSCNCNDFEEVTKKFRNNGDSEDGACVGCMDWAYRANLRIYASNQSHCYKFRWLSYDSFETPIADCFIINEEEFWFGLGDILVPHWSLNNLEFNETVIKPNFKSELPGNISKAQLGDFNFGSYAKLSLISSKGIFIETVNSTLYPSVSLHFDKRLGTKLMCASISKQNESNDLDFETFDDIFEYNICLGKDIDHWAKFLLARRTKLLPNNAISRIQSGFENPTKQIITESDNIIFTNNTPSSETNPLVSSFSIIDRPIFVTSLDYMPDFDGQTLRQFVDTIIKIELKASCILLIDSRWQSYVGSMKINTARFPKYEVLFEILRNKGFKIIFAVKPYIDASIGMGNLQKLVEAGRIYVANPLNGLPISTKNQSNKTQQVTLRRKSFFHYKTIYRNTTSQVAQSTIPYLFKCRESADYYCVAIDLASPENKQWFVDSILQSSLKLIKADGIHLGGTHPLKPHWQSDYRKALDGVANDLMYMNNFFTLPEYSASFGFIQIAPRSFTWNGLKSTLSSVLNLSLSGFALVHPGSIGGDIRSKNFETNQKAEFHTELFVGSRANSVFRTEAHIEDPEHELYVRWLQLAVFMPILQFNNIQPIEKYKLQELLQRLIKMRKTTIIPEIKTHLSFTPLVHKTLNQTMEQQMLASKKSPLIKPVWQVIDGKNNLINDEFLVGDNILVAPVLSEKVRQRDIFLPIGFWNNELSQQTVRGGKWLRNHSVELNEILWFTRNP